MKKILSASLAILVAACMPVAYAAPNEQDYTQGTVVEYIADANTNRWYTITVPAKMTPKLGQKVTGTVTLTGQWASDEIIKITSDTEVLLTNSINSNDTATLDVTLPVMECLGDNTAQLTYTETVTLEDMPATALFGEWSGKFNYHVEVETISQVINPVSGAWYFADGMEVAFALVDNKILIGYPDTTWGLVKDYEIIDDKLIVDGIERGAIVSNSQFIAHNLYAGPAYTDTYTYTVNTEMAVNDYFEFDDSEAYFYSGAMTWAEYVDSEYNPIDIYDEGPAFAIINDSLYIQTGDHGLYQPVYHNGEKVPYDSLIVSKGLYSRYN